MGSCPGTCSQTITKMLHIWGSSNMEFWPILCLLLNVLIDCHRQLFLQLKFYFSILSDLFCVIFKSVDNFPI